MPGYGGNGHGDQPFTADRSIPNTTTITTPIPVDLNNQNFKDSTTLSELNRTAQWLVWDKTNLNRLSWDLSTDNLNYGSALDNNELITAVKYSLNDPYDPTVDSPCSKRGSASEPVSLLVVKKPETSDKSNGRAPKLTPISYADVVKFPPAEPDNAIKPEKYYTVSNELVDEVVVEGIMASKDSHTLLRLVLQMFR